MQDTFLLQEGVFVSVAGPHVASSQGTSRDNIRTCAAVLGPLTPSLIKRVFFVSCVSPSKISGFANFETCYNIFADIRNSIGQTTLAKLVYRRQATISDFENGKSEIGVLMLANLALELGKPISYFFRNTKLGELIGDLENSEQEELLNAFKYLEYLGWGELALEQVKSLTNYFSKVEKTKLGFCFR
jgi:transcriptional regulator with XRE-family HTH domain